MSIEHNKIVARTFVEAMSEADRAKADACLAPDAFTLSKGFGKFAGRRSRDVMVGTIDAFQTLLPTGLRLSTLSMTAEGDRVVAECEGDATTSDGKAYCNQYCFIFTFNAEGKIRQLNEYFCNVLADEVLWPLLGGKAELSATGV